MYRPPGWKNPHQWYDMNRALMTFEVNKQEKHEAFEAGADAMLEGLKKDSIELVIGKNGVVPIVPESMPYLINLVTRGYLVFIPEVIDGK